MESSKNRQIKLLGLILGFMAFTIPDEFASANVPLQPGTYYRGSQYITVGVKNKRLCYVGVSRNGVTIASLIPDTKILGAYRIYNFSGLMVRQKSKNTLLFGDKQMMSEMTLEPGLRVLEMFAGELDKCLNSTPPYFKQLPPP
jgi:hypothetical protein